MYGTQYWYSMVPEPTLPVPVPAGTVVQFFVVVLRLSKRTINGNTFLYVFLDTVKYEKNVLHYQLP